MTWVTRVCRRMARCTLLREQLGDLASPPDEIYRPKGMQKRDFRRKVALLARLEESYLAELDFKLGKWQKRQARLNKSDLLKRNTGINENGINIDSRTRR